MKMTPTSHNDRDSLVVDVVVEVVAEMVVAVVKTEVVVMMVLWTWTCGGGH